MEAEEFSVAVEQGANGTVVWVAGEVDLATSPQLDECLKSLNGAPVAVDFSMVTVIDVSGIATIVRAMNHAAELGTSFALRDVQPMQRRVLEIAGLAEDLDLDLDG